MKRKPKPAKKKKPNKQMSSIIKAATDPKTPPEAIIKLTDDE